MGYTLNSILKRKAFITPELLVGLYAGVTDAQGYALAKRYEGKYLVVAGRMGTEPLALARRRADAKVYAEESGVAEVPCHCSFAGRKNVADIKTKRKGDEVALIGKIEGVSREGIILFRCRVMT
jgi:hypothetical protein